MDTRSVNTNYWEYRCNWVITQVLACSQQEFHQYLILVANQNKRYIGVMVITYADFAPIRRKLSYGPIRNCNRKASAILNLEAWFVSGNLRRLHQGKFLRSHGFSLLYSKRYQPSLHSLSREWMRSKAFGSSGRIKKMVFISNFNRVNHSTRRQNSTLSIPYTHGGLRSVTIRK